MSQNDVCTILPNLGGLLAVPTPTQHVFALLKVSRDDHFICDTPLGDVFAKARVPRQRLIEFSAWVTYTVRFGRSSSAAQAIASDLGIPCICRTTALLVRRDRIQRSTTMFARIFTDLASWNWIHGPLTSLWKSALSDFPHWELVDDTPISVENERGVASKLQRCPLEALLRHSVTDLAETVVVSTPVVC
jgi:hypothetical protein